MTDQQTLSYFGTGDVCQVNTPAPARRYTRSG